MNVVVNGEARDLAAGTTVAALLRGLGIDGNGIAVAVNDRVVRRSGFGEHSLADGDAVEIIRAVAGG